VDDPVNAIRAGSGAVPGIDREGVGAWLGVHLPQLEPPYAFERIGEGQSNLTYRVTDSGGRTVVLRRPPLGEILASAHDMSREHAVLAALSAAGAPVPATLVFCGDASVTGAPFYVMSHVDGLVLSTIATAETLDEESRRTTGLELARTLATVHAFDVDEIGLAALRRPESLIERQLRRWTRQWHASKTRELGMIDRLAGAFAERMPAEEAQVLVHGDYHLGNAIVGPRGTVAAVLDWELCTIGDPLADVGLMIAYWNELAAAADREDVLFREPVTSLPGFPTAGELAAEYGRTAGRELADLGFWVAFAYWKVAIIVEGVYRRWLNDPANGSDAGTLGPAVDRLAALAADALDASAWSEVGSSRPDG
jgi:aminoglycoside phosphotransferase (APT) family kinase protein